MKFTRHLTACAFVLAAAFLLILPSSLARLTPGNNATAQSPPRAEPAPREFTVAVLNKQGHPIRGLTRADFKVFDGKEEREIVSFSDADTPATVGILLDASGSIGSDSRGALARVGNGLLRFFQNCNARDEFFLIAFNQSPQLLLDISNDPADVMAAIERYVAAKPKGQTAFYDALYLALNRVARGKHSKSALVVVTDGQDNMSRYTFREVEQALKESDVILYAVAISEKSDGSTLGYDARAILEDLAGLSGGAAFYASGEKEINDVMIRIAAELREHYTLAFVPARGARKDGWHDLKLKLGELRDAQGTKVKPFARARHGFYDAPAAQR